MKIVFMASGTARSNFSYRILVLAKELHKLGHETVLIAPSADKYNGFKNERIAKIDGVRILQPFQLVTKNLLVNLLPYLFTATWRVLRERPDVVYIYKPTPLSVTGLIARLIPGTRVLLDMDDLGAEVMKIEGQAGLMIKLVAGCERLAARWSHGIVAASTYLERKYQREFPDKPVYWLPNGVDPSWFASRLPALSAKKRIVFMGSLDRKNILTPLFDALPSICKRVPSAEALIIGDGSERQYFENHVASKGLNSYVTFVGWQQIEVARQMLIPGDLGYVFVPNEKTLKAASSMKAPQYMARGVVPVVSKVGDLPATIDGGDAGYICPANTPIAFADTIVKAFHDKDRANKSKRAIGRAKKTYSWSVLAKGLDSWMQETYGTKKT